MLIRTVLRVYLGTWTSCTRARRISASHKFTLLSIPPTPPTPPPSRLSSTAEVCGRLVYELERPPTRALRTHMQVYSLSTESSCSLFVLGCHSSGVVRTCVEAFSQGVDVLGGLNGENQRKAVAYILEISHYSDVHFVNVVYQIIC